MGKRGCVPPLLLLLGPLTGLGPVPSSSVSDDEVFSCLDTWLVVVVLSQGRRAFLFLLSMYAAVLRFHYSQGQLELWTAIVLQSICIQRSKMAFLNL